MAVTTTPALREIWRFKQRLCYLLLKKHRTRKQCLHLAKRFLKALVQLGRKLPATSAGALCLTILLGIGGAPINGVEPGVERRALAALLEQAATEPATAAYIRERSAVLRQHAERQGGATAPSGADACATSIVSEASAEPFACRFPGQNLSVAGRALVFAAPDDASSAPGALTVMATGLCGVVGQPAGEGIPTCAPEFFAAATSSPPSATIAGLSASYVRGVGCAVTSGQLADALMSETEAFSRSLRPRADACTCPVQAVSPYSPDPYGVDIQGLTQATQTALSCLQTAAQRAGGSISVQSAYRPDSYQAHLREVWDKNAAIQGKNGPECAAVKANIQAEMSRHSIIYQPALHSNHSAGTAFDANWPGVNNIDVLAQGCGLSRCVAGDNTHFCLVQ